MRTNTWKNLELKIALLVLLVVLLISTGLYFFTFNQYYDLMIDQLKLDAVNVHKYAEEVIDERSFYEINSVDDHYSELYLTTHSQMDEIRRIAHVLYLYTAKINSSGDWVYVVDAWEKYDENFVEAGQPVGEADDGDALTGMLDRVLEDEVVFGDRILDTEWGVVYVTYFPFHDSAGNVIGAIGIEFDCEDLQAAVNRTRLITVLVSVLLAAGFVALSYVILRRVVRDTETVIVKMEESVRDANERTTLMLDTSPMGAHILDRYFNIIDCNEAAVTLYGFKSKQEYIDRFFDECIPVTQPGGENSAEKRLEYINQAFEDGYSVFDLIYKKPDDETPMPAEITLVRTDYHGSDVVVAYTRDLRDITQMVKKISHLENENKKVFYDSLTRIYNRRFFDETAGRVMNSLSRSGGTLSVMMIDIDYFKKYNDTYGHGAGDNCLRLVAEALAKGIRPDDFIARYGGEEFVAVLPNTDEAGARTVAERMLANIRELRIPHEASDAADHVTISVGVVSGTVLHSHVTDDFLRRADDMLYKSKQRGRNRYSFGRY